MNLPLADSAAYPADGRAKLSAALIGVVVIAALGGFLFGFDTAVISGTTDWLKRVFQLNDSELGFTVASALVGTIVGALAAGRPADAYGRRAVLFVLAILFLISSVGCGLAWNWWSFIVFRFLGGIGVGGASVVSPMYIAEISPARHRGRLVAVTQFNVVLGILVAYLSNYFLAKSNLGEAECRWMFGVMAIPSAAFFLLLFLSPQSPRWLVARGRLAEAKAIFARFGSDTGDPDEEIRAIQRSHGAATQEGPPERLLSKKYLRPIFLAIAMAVFNQLSGINALIYYTKFIFESAGINSSDALLQSVIIGVVNLFFTVIAMSIIDRLGRRQLMLYCSFGYIVSLSAVAYAFHVGGSGKLLLAGFVLFIASHAIGQGSVCLVFISEIFPNKVRSRGQALGCSALWISAALVSWTFPVLLSISASLTFAFYAFCCVVQLVWVIWVMPETKGVTLEDIQSHLGIS